MQGWKRLAPLVDDVAAHHMKLVHAGLLFLATWASAIDQGASAVVTRARCFRQPSRIKQRVCLSERAFGTPIQNVPARRNEDDGGQLAAKAFAGPALSTRPCTALTHVGAFHAETDQQHGEAAGGDEYLLRRRREPICRGQLCPPSLLEQVRRGAIRSSRAKVLIDLMALEPRVQC